MDGLQLMGIGCAVQRVVNALKCGPTLLITILCAISGYFLNVLLVKLLNGF